MVPNSQKILLASVIKYGGDWNKVYDSISTREEISEEEMEKLISSIKCKYFTIFDEIYPISLKNTNHPPFVLFYYGDISLISDIDRNLGVVGARKNSQYGERLTRELVKGVCDKLIIVSGLAKGIDSIAADECLKNNGKTVAVLGCGIDYCYPRENLGLYKLIKKKGLLLSEYPNEIPPIADYFPKRNRIIAGLSKNLLVPEAKRNSGTSITAAFAMEMGQTVFCVPERAGVDSLPNYLISYGAKITVKPIDILEEYNLTTPGLKFDL